MVSLKKLDQYEKKLMIEFLPKHEAIEFLKKNRKSFGKELDGVRMDLRSKLLQQKLPRILSNAIEREDKKIIDFIKKSIYKKLEEINQYIELKWDSKENIEEIIQKEQKERYMKLVNILLEKIEDKYILLFLNLNGIELKDIQKKLIKASIKEIALHKKIKQQVTKEEKENLKAKYKEEIKLIEEKGERLLKNEKEENNALKCKIFEKDKIIKKEKQKLNEKIQELDQQLKKYSVLKKRLQLVELQNKRIDEQIAEKENIWRQNLEKERQHTTELKVINETQNSKIKQLDNKLKERYEIYSQKYTERWEEEHQEILNQEKNLIEEISSLNNSIQVLQNEIIDLEVKKEKAKEKLNQYNDLVTNFINNIDKELIISALKESISNIDLSSKTKDENMKLYIKNQMKGNEIEVCESIDRWSEVISHNLKNIGVRRNRNEWSDYIVSVLAARIIPLIVGCKTREIAKAISCTYSGETPFIITLPGGYTEVNELIELYDNCEAKVILIEGVVGQMNESLMLPLFKEYIQAEDNDKIILVSCEDTNMVNIMPLYLFEYMAPIEIMDITPVVHYNYIYANSIRVLRLMRKNELEINGSYQKLRKLFKYIDDISPYIITRSLILAYLCKQREIEDALLCLSTCDLKSILKDDDIKEKIMKNIENYQNDFTQDLKNLIVGE